MRSSSDSDRAETQLDPRVLTQQQHFFNLLSSLHDVSKKWLRVLLKVKCSRWIVILYCDHI